MPDLNSVPPSPRVLASTRHSSSSLHGNANAASSTTTTTSSSVGATGASAAAATAPPPTTSQMPPPPIPTSPSSIHVFPSNQLAVNQGTTAAAAAAAGSALPSPYYPAGVAAFPLAPSSGLTTGPGQPGDGPGVGPGPGPLRHPRPLTAAELHMQLEKEQEAVVNRLTRELTLLRAQNASVVSNASSTSAGASSDAASSQTTADNAHAAAAAAHHHPYLSSGGTTGFSIPSSTGRHNRTYSNTSTRSQSNTAAAGPTSSTIGISSPAPIRPTAPNLSRQNSTASRLSRANSPGPQGSMSMSRSYSHSSHIGDVSLSSSNQSPQSFRASGGPGGGTTPSASDLSPAILPGTARYEETAFYRAELESVKRENEALKRRIRELERALAPPATAAAAGTTVTPGTTATSTTTTATTASTASPFSPHHQGSARDRRRSDASRGRSEGGRDGGRDRDRVASNGIQGAGIPEDEVRVGESASSTALDRQRQRQNEGN